MRTRAIKAVSVQELSSATATLILMIRNRQVTGSAPIVGFHVFSHLGALLTAAPQHCDTVTRIVTFQVLLVIAIEPVRSATNLALRGLDFIEVVFGVSGKSLLY